MSRTNFACEDKLASTIVIEEIQIEIKELKIEIDELLSNRDEYFPLQINTVLDHLRKAETAAQYPERAEAVWQALVQARIAIQDSGSMPVIKLESSSLDDVILPVVFVAPSSIAALNAEPDSQLMKAISLLASMVKYAVGFSPSLPRDSLYRAARRLLRPYGMIGRLKIGL
ncbi:MAG TPA: hypothetical protein VGD99_10495 [Anaerolineae bacterium]|jgi:hypothetical protein